ncbi:inactive non-canonical poly(A) RNA polymerase protein Trf4-2 [Drosophila sulfurigaster albostrigata]|uniref:inactive non-canonical poly(A) RNA polymerase protein Trf4-2 n=1 Tax=Drosophila sulfurigaster albostrigata TaxID=89887 RepID=UPI002D21BA01|nr:inactive non-canonical poly(A) RNA polymerase protein Trf4-2 [Drosophila sulfurigaster albostrigata]XP_062122491.1 inactive non-canonical poly(A) RNA polymerase protein Trf4-2 [Drosophila sulfurigaster albostrigata]
MNTTDEQHPWMLSNYEYGGGVNALHDEIEHFYNYIISTPTEYMMRMEAICRIESVVLSTWPQASIEVFGSFCTGLNLPVSDIDIAVNNFYWQGGEPLTDLKNALDSRGVADNIIVVDKARVPVVKFKERLSQIKFDISFNTTSGVKAAELVKMFIEQFPELPKLVLVLKQYLVQLGVNDVYNTGGVSSYALTLMCIGFLQKQALETSTATSGYKSHKKLGQLLLKFLEYYGRKFDFYNYAISVRRHGGCVEKTELLYNFGGSLSMLTIEDPITPSNNIGRSSFGVMYVKQCFQRGFANLSKMVDLDASKVNGSILAKLITMPETTIIYRNWVHYTFQHFANTGYGWGGDFHYAVESKYNATSMSEKYKQEEEEVVEEDLKNNFKDLSLSSHNNNGCENTKA